MTVSEWVYPGSAVITLLVGMGFCWQWQRNLRQQALQVSNDRAIWEQAQQDWEKQRLETVTPEGPPPAETLYLQGKIHHLELDLQRLHTLQQGQAAEVTQLHHDLQQRDLTILTLQTQVAHQEHHRQEITLGHHNQIKELRQENEVLSQRLQQEVIKQTQWRQQALLVEPLQSRLQTLEGLQLRWAEEKQTLETSYCNQITTLEANLVQQQEVWQQAQQQISQLQQELALQAQDWEQSQKIREQLEGREQELLTLNQQYEFLQKQLNQVQQENQSLQVRLETSQKEQTRWEDTAQTLQNQTELLKNQLQMQTEQVKSQTLTIQALEQELESLPVMQAVVPPAEFSLPEVVETVPPTESPLPEVVETVPPAESSLPEVVETVPPEESSLPEVVETVPPAPETISEPVEVIIETPEPVLKPLAGKKLVIAGTLSHLNREETKVQIQAAGGTVTHSPSSKTDYVVVGKAPGEKLKKAQKLGIAQLSEAQLLKLLGLEF